ncbi:MAG: hypothetical protein JWM52_817 [Candidatus Saccharibacteria bacterium]|nr:hypothetical protein [Candidatus Saccharibacteria bacterium]
MVELLALDHRTTAQTTNHATEADEAEVAHDHQCDADHDRDASPRERAGDVDAGVSEHLDDHAERIVALLLAFETDLVSQSRAIRGDIGSCGEQRRNGRRDGVDLVTGSLFGAGNRCDCRVDQDWVLGRLTSCATVVVDAERGRSLGRRTRCEGRKTDVEDLATCGDLVPDAVLPAVLRANFLYRSRGNEVAERTVRSGDVELLGDVATRVVEDQPDRAERQILRDAVVAHLAVFHLHVGLDDLAVSGDLGLLERPGPEGLGRTVLTRQNDLLGVGIAGGTDDGVIVRPSRNRAVVDPRSTVDVEDVALGRRAVQRGDRDGVADRGQSRAVRATLNHITRHRVLQLADAVQRDRLLRVPGGATFEVVLNPRRRRGGRAGDVRLREGHNPVGREWWKVVVRVMLVPLVQPDLRVDAVDQRARREVLDDLEVHLTERAVVADCDSPEDRPGPCGTRCRAVEVDGKAGRAGTGDGHRSLGVHEVACRMVGPLDVDLLVVRARRSDGLVAGDGTRVLDGLVDERGRRSPALVDDRRGLVGVAGVTTNLPDDVPLPRGGVAGVRA